MRTHHLLLAFAIVCGTAGAAQADVFKKDTECKVGRRVTDKANKSGTVLAMSDQMCHVRLDDGKETYYLFWMLRAAGASAETSDRLVPGTYECFAGGRYTFMDMKITGAATYSSAGASGRFHVEPSRKIVFETGPLSKNFAHLLAGPAIGLNTDGGTFWATTCELKK